MGKFWKGQRVEHVQTGVHGTVTDPATDDNQVSWDPNEHGGYIDYHEDREIRGTSEKRKK